MMVSIFAQRLQVGMLIFSLPHVATLGCDREPGSEVSVRAAKSIDLNEPIPGGGVCHGCITDWEIVTPDAEKDERWLRLCVNTRAKYTGSSVLVDDDLPLDNLLTSAESKWELLAKGSDLCKDGCVGVPESDDPESSYKIISVELDAVDDRTPSTIRFHEVSGSALKPGENLPSVALPPQSLNFKCAAKPVPVNVAIDRPLPSDPARTALAHITHPSPSGGVRSCSGFLVSARHVLTADHCFEAPDDSSTIEIRLGDATAPIGVSAIHRYDPDLNEIADLDLAVLELEVPVQTEPLKIAHPATSMLGELYGYGYGVIDPLTLDTDYSYDWAQLKRVALKVISRPSALPPQDPNTLYLKAQMGGSVGLCRGDSGGPVIRGDGRVVAVSFGRVVKASRGPSGLHETAKIEPTMRAFAFSRGNICGDTPLLAYAAVHIDAGVYQWLNVVAGPLSLADPPIDLPLPQEPTE